MKQLPLFLYKFIYPTNLIYLVDMLVLEHSSWDFLLLNCLFIDK